MVDIQKTNLQDLLSVVAEVRVLKWGSEVQIDCLDDPVTRQHYVLVFKKCTEIRWYAHDLANVLEPVDDLGGIMLGKENYQEPAIITGFIFELWVMYESFEIQKL